MPFPRRVRARAGRPRTHALQDGEAQPRPAVGAALRMPVRAPSAISVSGTRESRTRSPQAVQVDETVLCWVPLVQTSHRQKDGQARRASHRLRAERAPKIPRRAEQPFPAFLWRKPVTRVASRLLIPRRDQKIKPSCLCRPCSRPYQCRCSARTRVAAAVCRDFILTGRRVEILLSPGAAGHEARRSRSVRFRAVPPNFPGENRAAQ